MSKNYEYHPISNTYPMMSKKEFSNLIGSMEDDGYDEKYPILLYENKILDGRNRYKASGEAEVAPVFEKFEGTYEEAIGKSRQANSYRRNLDKSQKAMVASKEVLLSREAEGKNLSVKRASILHAVSEGYIKMAMKIIDEDDKLAKSVFEGTMTIKEATYRIEQIEALRAPSIDDIGTYDITPEDSQTQEIIQEFNTDVEATASRMVELQDNYQSVIVELEFYRENCDKHP